MLHLLAALLLSQTATAATPTTPSPTPRQILVLDLQPVAVPAEKAQILTARIAQTLVRRGLEVVTSADLRQLAELEATRSAMDCDSVTASCIAEIASALGTRFVVSGQVGELDKDHLFLQLSLFDGELQRAVSREEATGNSFAQLADAVAPTLDRLIATGTTTATATALSATTAKEPSLLAPIGGGVAGIGVIGLAVAGIWATRLDSTLGSPTARAGAKQTALDQRPYALGALGAGAAVTVVGGAVLILGLLQE